VGKSSRCGRIFNAAACGILETSSYLAEVVTGRYYVQPSKFAVFSGEIRRSESVSRAFQVAEQLPRRHCDGTGCACAGTGSCSAHGAALGSGRCLAADRAKRKHSNSCFRMLSHSDTVHLREAPMLNHCTALRVLSVVHTTEKNRNIPSIAATMYSIRTRGVR